MASHSAALRTEAPSAAALVRALLNVFKLRIGLAIMLCALAGIAVTPGPALEPWQVVVLALAVLLSSASAGAFNQYVERDLDAAHEAHAAAPVRHRPVPPGAGLAARHRPPARGLGPGGGARHQLDRRRARVPRRVRLWRRVHGLAQAPQLDQHRRRRPRRQLRRPRRRRGGRSGSGPDAFDPRGRAVPLDAAALLEPRHRPAQGLCRGPTCRCCRW